MKWTDPDAPRLWRSWDILPYRNEPLTALDTCSDDMLAHRTREKITFYAGQL